MIGHGTGSMPDLYRRAAAGESGAQAVTSVNPHNQFFAVAIQLGLLGGAILIAMWIAHLALFRGSGLVAWLGIVIVVQNVVSSLFNSHLFDFLHGWLYVFGLGVIGGMALHQARAKAGGRYDMSALPAPAAHPGRRAAAARRRAADHAADPQFEARLSGRRDRRAGVSRARKAFSPAIRISRTSSRCRSGPAPARSFALLRKLWRRYDLAISTQSGDRPTFYAWAAGRRSAGFVEGEGALARVKRFALTDPVEIVGNTHRVREVLRLAEALGIAPVAELVAPQGAPSPGVAPARPYAVIHAAPMYRYKRWTDDGWRGLAAALAARGLAVVATGGPGDRHELDAIWAARAGRETARRRALVAGACRADPGRVGLCRPRHLGDASGQPRPARRRSRSTARPIRGCGGRGRWAASIRSGMRPGTIQARGNVWLVQNPLPCLPCQQEGCLRRRDSHSQCLDELSVGQVLKAVDAALADPAGRRSA